MSSPGSSLPPGQARLPLHGSPRASRLLISNVSYELRSQVGPRRDGRSISAIAARRAAGYLTKLDGKSNLMVFKRPSSLVQVPKRVVITAPNTDTNHRQNVPLQACSTPKPSTMDSLGKLSCFGPSSIGDLCMNATKLSLLGVDIDRSQCDCIALQDGSHHSISYVQYVSTHGTDALPVLCVHGLTRNGSDFDVLARALAVRGHEVVAVDIAGRRWSDKLVDPTGYNYRQYVSDMDALVSHLKWKKFHWVGTSMGGLIAMHWMAEPRPWASADGETKVIDLRNSGKKSDADSSPAAPTASGTASGAASAPPHRRPQLASLVLNDIGAHIGRTALQRIAGYVGKPPLFPGIKEAAEYVSGIYSGFGPCPPSLRDRMALKVARLLVRAKGEGGKEDGLKKDASGGASGSATGGTPGVVGERLAAGRKAAEAAARAVLEDGGSGSGSKDSGSGAATGGAGSPVGAATEARIPIPVAGSTQSGAAAAPARGPGLSPWSDGDGERAMARAQAAIEAAREAAREQGCEVQVELAYDPRIAAGFGDPAAITKDADLWPLMERARCGPLLVLHGAKSDILSAECAARMVAGVEAGAEAGVKDEATGNPRLAEARKEAIDAGVEVFGGRSSIADGIRGPRGLFVEEGAGHVPALLDERQVRAVCAWITFAECIEKK